MKADELRALIAGFYGGGDAHQWSILFRRCRLSEGMNEVCKAAGAFWLADAIASYQPQLWKVEEHRYQQYWKLEVKDGKGLLTCGNSNVRQKFGCTDFPEGDWEFNVGPAYYGEGQNDYYIMICLPAER